MMIEEKGIEEESIENHVVIEFLLECGVGGGIRWRARET